MWIITSRYKADAVLPAKAGNGTTAPGLPGYRNNLPSGFDLN